VVRLRLLCLFVWLLVELVLDVVLCLFGVVFEYWIDEGMVVVWFIEVEVYVGFGDLGLYVCNGCMLCM